MSIVDSAGISFYWSCEGLTKSRAKRRVYIRYRDLRLPSEFGDGRCHQKRRPGQQYLEYPRHCYCGYRQGDLAVLKLPLTLDVAQCPQSIISSKVGRNLSYLLSTIQETPVPQYF